MPTQAERTEATRGRLIATARRLFAEKGFAATSTEEILSEAEVSRGALYHHFSSKTDLFRATFEAVEDELTAKLLEVATAGGETDPIRILELGFDAFLDECLNPEVQRIVMLDGPTVLGWDTWHELDERYAFGTIKAVLSMAAEMGRIDPPRSIPSRISSSARSCRPAWWWRGPTTPPRRSSDGGIFRAAGLDDLAANLLRHQRKRHYAEANFSPTHAGNRDGLPRRSTDPCTVTAVARTSPATDTRYAIWKVVPVTAPITERDVHLFVKAQRLAVAQGHLEDREVAAVLSSSAAHRAVGVLD